MAPAATPVANEIARAMRPVELPSNLQPAAQRRRATLVSAAFFDDLRRSRAA